MAWQLWIRAKDYPSDRVYEGYVATPVGDEETFGDPIYLEADDAEGEIYESLDEAMWVAARWGQEADHDTIIQKVVPVDADIDLVVDGAGDPATEVD